MKRILVRHPSRHLADGLVTHVERQSVDVDVAVRQWHGYVDCFASRGWDVVEVDRADEFPDSVFIEDAAVMFDGRAIAARPGAAERIGEVDAVVDVLRRLGYPLLHLADPATLDGGDVLKVGRTAFVGISGRSNRAATDGLREVLEPDGWTVVGVPLRRVLHLKSAVTALPDGTIIGWPAAVDDPAAFPNFLAMPEERGSHVVDLGDGDLLVDAAAVTSHEVLRQRGYHPVGVEIGEFVKLEGCVTCLSIRIRHEPGD